MKTKSFYKAKALTFKKIKVKKNVIYLFYEFDDGIKFSRTLTFKNSLGTLDELDIHILTHVGILYCFQIAQCRHPKKIIIEPSTFTQKQIEFWKKLYINISGQAFFLNKIPFKYAPKLIFNKRDKNNFNNTRWNTKKNKAIFGFGGGKESLASLYLLLKTQLNLSILRVIQKHKKEKGDILKPLMNIIMADVNKKNGNNGVINIYREPSEDIPKFFNYKKPAFGPAVARIAFIMLFLSKQHGFRDLIVGTEWSSNFGNVMGRQTY
jgi:hypothetical protein